MEKKHDDKFITSLVAIVGVVGVVAIVGLFLGMGIPAKDLAGQTFAAATNQECCEWLDLMEKEIMQIFVEFGPPTKIETWSQIYNFKSRVNQVAKDLEDYRNSWPLPDLRQTPGVKNSSWSGNKSGLRPFPPP